MSLHFIINDGNGDYNDNNDKDDVDDDDANDDDNTCSTKLWLVRPYDGFYK